VESVCLNWLGLRPVKEAQTSHTDLGAPITPKPLASLNDFRRTLKDSLADEGHGDSSTDNDHAQVLGPASKASSRPGCQRRCYGVPRLRNGPPGRSYRLAPR